MRLGAIALGVVLASTQAARAQSPEEDFAAGVAAFDAEDFTGALAAFRRSYHARPVPEVLFNIAVAERRLGEVSDALRDFLRFLRDAPTSARRAEAERQVRELVPLVGTVRLQIRPAGASVRVDGEAIGTAPLGEEVVLRPGRHVLVVEADEHETHRQELVVEAGGSESIGVTLAPRAERGLDAPVPGGGDEDHASALPWVLLTGAGALAMIAGGVLLAIGAADRHRVEDAEMGTAWVDVQDAYDRAATRQNVGWALLGGGAALAGAGVVGLSVGGHW